MQRVNFTGLTNSHATITGGLMAIFSRQPVDFVLYTSELPYTACRLAVTNTATGASFSEERDAIEDSSTTRSCEFEISRMLQLVCPTDDILKRVSYDGEAHSLADSVRLTFSVKRSGEWVQYASRVVECLHASCDWGESINSARTARRMWVNFPNTLPCGQYTGEEYIEVTGNEEHERTTGGAYSNADAGYELDAMTYLADEADSIVDTLVAGHRAQIVLGNNGVIANGQGTKIYGDRVFDIVPYCDAVGRGVYLRWLTRYGAVGYWLFDKSKRSVTASVAQSFERTPEGVPAQPQNGVIDNPARQSFSVAEQLTIGAPEITDEEYDYLLGLAQSPCVEMLVDGSDRNAPVWARVTIVPATYSLDIPRSELPRVRDFELQIVLPQRNTARL